MIIKHSGKVIMLHPNGIITITPINGIGKHETIKPDSPEYQIWLEMIERKKERLET